MIVATTTLDTLRSLNFLWKLMGGRSSHELSWNERYLCHDVALGNKHRWSNVRVAHITPPLVQLFGESTPVVCRGATLDV
jgi:hypothetical protein